MRLAAVLVAPGREAHYRALLGPDIAVESVFSKLSAGPFGLAVDCGGHAGLSLHGPEVLEAGIDLAVLSVGALADPEVEARLVTAAEAGGSRLEILSGALAGLDALAAAKAGGLEAVTYRARKAPGAWQGTPAAEMVDLSSLSEPFCHFKGSAREAALRYPKNANVTAAIALAGLGFDETRVELIADPRAKGNRHELSAVGQFGSFESLVVGATLADSPRTSMLAALSALRAITARLPGLRV